MALIDVGLLLGYTAVYEAIQEIPRGKVTSYAHIARLVGKREPIFCLAWMAS